MESPIVMRVHITFGKFDALRYTGNLDIAKVWERVLRRAKLPILYTQGFNTRPRIKLATALALGITSECEILDVALREEITLDGVLERVDQVSPDGLRVYDIHSVPVDGRALQSLIRSSEYRIQIKDAYNRDELQQRIESVLAAEQIIKIEQKRRGGKVRKIANDLRPMIYDVYIDDEGDVIAHIAAGERGNLHPRDLVRELGLEDTYLRIHRFRLHMDDYYQRLEQRKS